MQYWIPLIKNLISTRKFWFGHFFHLCKLTQNLYRNSVINLKRTEFCDRKQTVIFGIINYLFVLYPLGCVAENLVLRWNSRTPWNFFYFCTLCLINKDPFLCIYGLITHYFGEGESNKNYARANTFILNSQKTPNFSSGFLLQKLVLVVNSMNWYVGFYFSFILWKITPLIFLALIQSWGGYL